MASYKGYVFVICLASWVQPGEGTLSELEKFLNGLNVPTGSPTCNRPGVTCNGTNYAVDLSSVSGVSGNLNDIGTLTQLTALKLPPYSAITGPIPGSISSCTLLESIHISFLSGLTGPLPTGLFALPKLKEVTIVQCKKLGGSSLPADLANFKGEQLSLYGNDFEGSIPAGFGSLPSLLSADLSQNKFSGNVPEFSSTCKLTFLSFSKNSLTGSVPASVGNCAGLKYFNINSNKLSGSLPSELGRLSQVEQIWLNSNQLTGTIPASVAKLPAIKILRLNANKLEGPLPSLLFTTIEQLFLFANQITGPLPASVCNLTEVSKLSVRTNKLSGPLPSCLGKLTKLKLLWLFGNEFTGALPANLGDIAGLERLRANDNQFIGPLPAGLKSITTLWELHLGNNPFNSALPDLSGMTSLTDLKASACGWTGTLPGLPSSVETVLLSGNKLTGPVPSTWQNLPAVRNVDVSNNQISSWVTWGTFPGFGVCTGSGTQVATEPTWTSLLDFSASGNPLGVAAQAFMQTFAYSPQLQRLSCSDCGLTGTLEAKSLTRFQWAGECQWHESFLSLQYLDLQKNELTKVVANSQWQLSTLLLADNKLQEVHPSYFGGTFGSARITRFDIVGNPLTGRVKPPGAGTCADWMAADSANAAVVASSQSGSAGVCVLANELNWAALPSQPEVECTSAIVEAGSPQAEGVSVYLSYSFNETELCRCAAGYHGVGKSCSKTPQNTYTVTGNTKAPIACPANTLAPNEGSSSLDGCVCAPAYFKVAPGACARCPGATYRDTPGAIKAEDCTACPTNMITMGGAGGVSRSDCFCKEGMFSKDGSTCSSCPLATYAKPGGKGQCESCGFAHATTPVASATSYTECVCQSGFFHPCAGNGCSSSNYTELQMKHDGFCQPCPKGMSCQGGFAPDSGLDSLHLQPSVLAGRMSLPEDPHSVYLCKPRERCAGGLPATCAGGYEGRVCGRCPEGSIAWGSECSTCGGLQIFFIILFFVIAIGVLIVLHRVLAGHHSWKLTPNMALKVSCDALLILLQILAVLFSVEIMYPEGLHVFRWLAAVSHFFELNLPAIVPFACIFASASDFKNMGTYLISTLALPILAGLVFLLRLASNLAPQKYRWGYPCAYNLCGRLFTVLFLSQVFITMQPFMCYSHPNGHASLIKYPGTMCGESDHILMCVIAVIMLLAAVAYVVYCSWIIKNLAKVVSATQGDRLEQYKFFIELLRLDRPKMWISQKIKEFLLALVLVIEPNVMPNQVMLFGIIVSVFVVIGCRQWAWKAPFINLMYVSLQFCFLLLLVVIKGYSGGGHEGSNIYAEFAAALTFISLIALVAVPLCNIAMTGLNGQLFRVIIMHKPMEFKDVSAEWAKISNIKPEDLPAIIEDWEIYDLKMLKRCVQVMRPNAMVQHLHDAMHATDQQEGSA